MFAPVLSSLMINTMMTAPSEIRTARLRLRQVCQGDLADFSAMNADAKVMEFFPSPWSLEESQAALERISQGFTERGFGPYAIEFEKEFAGVAGLSVPSFQAYFTPCVEILWRLSSRFWSKGIASEAAAAVLHMAFHKLLLPEIVAFTALENTESIRVMERLGMVRDQRAYFDHPVVTDPRLRRHVLYRAKPTARVGE
jgi:RimJ/RimL family protein N-acetyltransferase